MSTLELSQPRMQAGTARLQRPPGVSSTADAAIRASTAAVVLAVAGIAAYISYWHAYTVVRQYGESGVTALLEPRHDRRPGLRLLGWLSCTPPGTGCPYRSWPAGCSRSASPPRSPSNVSPGLVPRPGRCRSGSLARGRAGGLLPTARLDDPDHGRGRTGPPPSPDHAVPQADQPGPSRWPLFPVRETVTAVAPGDGATPGPGSAHDTHERPARLPRYADQD